MAPVGEAPEFWWQRADWRAWSLWPFSSLYGLAATTRMAAARREKVAAAILCVGNFTVGGEGKTPVAIALAKEARRRKLKIAFLTRGHGGRVSAPHRVDPKHDSSALVGDEPLLLARHAPTVVASRREAGARYLIDAGFDFIIMDDGFQSAHIHMDYALIVVDARRGLGNGHVLPGGPLRAPLVDQMRHTDAVLTLGEGHAADSVIRHAARAGRPVYSARLKPRKARTFRGARVLAFAGIGNPRKFYDTLRDTGAKLAATRSFPDHYPFTLQDVAELEARAEADDLRLVTTEKDLVRLDRGLEALRTFAQKVEVLPVEAVFENADTTGTIIEETLARWRERMLSGGGR
ncbi:tetraacyldisaccharide 4'-kinase [Chelativorans sp. Marseille-P2723]|uniref:tetraacyldisaccharide 4'-kinase n=1 Tax=Chelativorans sp. Marseille-P2723 TaxID=2709133 RepID=UPI00156E7FD8|nr:tetraacyldisaccharide 4'-kinase [Chelativorans sp. Marseille-P2723]